MPAFDEKYTPTQREAMAVAYEDRRIRPARLVSDLAARGELELNGERVPAFETNPNTVRDCARTMRLRRAGEIRSDLAAMPPRDAIEALRRRLVNAADSELAAWERQKPGGRDMDKHRQISRAVLEASRLPGPGDPRPPSRGTTDPETGKQYGVQTKGGLAGSLIKAHEAQAPGNAEGPHSGGPSNGATTDG